MRKLKFIAAAGSVAAALGLPAGATADQVRLVPGEPIFSGFGNGGQSNGATVCHFHNPGVTVTNHSGTHGTGVCGE